MPTTTLWIPVLPIGRQVFRETLRMARWIFGVRTFISIAYGVQWARRFGLIHKSSLRTAVLEYGKVTLSTMLWPRALLQLLRRIHGRWNSNPLRERKERLYVEGHAYWRERLSYFNHYCNRWGYF